MVQADEADRFGADLTFGDAVCKNIPRLLEESFAVRGGAKLQVRISVYLLLFIELEQLPVLLFAKQMLLKELDRNISLARGVGTDKFLYLPVFH